MAPDRSTEPSSAGLTQTEFDQQMAHQEAATIDPHPMWARRRVETPQAVPNESGGYLCELFTRHEIDAVLRDSTTFSSSIGQQTMGPFMGRVILGMDGDEHARYRKLVSHAFRASALERWEHELIRPTIDALVSDIEDRGRADLVATVTRLYPSRVIAGIMGVEVDDHRQFSDWAVAINAGPLAPEAGLAASQAMRDYLEPIVADRRAHPRVDLISDIVHAEVDGEVLDDDHIYGFLRLLMPAGAETTYRELGILLIALLSHRDWWVRIGDEPDLIPRVIEETLRWDGSAPFVVRTATTDTEVGGCPIPAGSTVMLALGSANRDDKAFEQPDEWDPAVERATPHFAFGWGRHLCLGMHLARLELATAVDVLRSRLPELRLDPEKPPPEIRGVAFRGPEELHAVW